METQLIAGQYDVILMDPPWRFDVWNRSSGIGRTADKHYETMTDRELMALDPFRLAAENCAMLLWVTRPKQAVDVPEIVAAWNARYERKRRFSYRTELFTWVKTLRKGDGFHFGTGYYSRANTEAVWLYVRGQMPVADRSVPQLIVAPINERHSRKPDEQYERIERLWPGARKVELFATQRRSGWDATGYGVDGIDVRTLIGRSD